MKLTNSLFAALTLTTSITPVFCKEQVPLVENTAVFQGSLGYLDYSSGKSVSIPMELSFTPSADNKHLVIDKVYTDPGYKVYSMSVLTLDLQNKQVRETSFDGEEKYHQQYSIIAFDYIDAGNWSLQRQGIKQDDNQDARVVITDRMSDNMFTSETIVDYLATTTDEKLKRNWVRARSIHTQDNVEGEK